MHAESLGILASSCSLACDSGQMACRPMDRGFVHILNFLEMHSQEDHSHGHLTTCTSSYRNKHVCLTRNYKAQLAVLIGIQKHVCCNTNYTYKHYNLSRATLEITFKTFESVNVCAYKHHHYLLGGKLCQLPLLCTVS